jgi:hypothetical protein
MRMKKLMLSGTAAREYAVYAADAGFDDDFDDWLFFAGEKQ